MRKQGTKIKFFKGEKLLGFVLIMMIIATPVLIVFSKATLSKTNIEVERLKSKIDKQTGLNESLYMKINELASLDNIEDIAKAEGLSYNNDNIKTIVDN
ncbi:MAG TPA: cell division protein FtsL [Bacilli bacterium]|nr:cell division protein FtsL [Bacilli bacterium]